MPEPGRNPRIILDALLVGPEPTGVGRSVLELVTALAASPRGYSFHVLATDPAPFGFLARHSAWEVHKCPGAAGGVVRKALFTQFRMPGICRRLGGDLLHSTQFITPLRLGVPRVVTVHDLAWKSHAGILQTSRRLYYDFMVPRSLAAAAAIVTNSESTASEVRGFIPDRSARVSCTPFGTPTWVWDQPADPPVPVPGECPRYFLFVGTLEPRKNLERLLEAYIGFRQDSLEAGQALRDIPQLWLAGARGWNDSHLREMIAGGRDQGWLRTLDYCPPARLWGLYRHSQGLVFPSLQEGFGFPILEAMAAGCPVLTSGRGATREVAGEYGALFVEPEDVQDIRRGLASLAWDLEARARLRAGGPDRARSWDWERTALATCAVYGRVLASR